MSPALCIPNFLNKYKMFHQEIHHDSDKTLINFGKKELFFTCMPRDFFYGCFYNPSTSSNHEITQDPNELEKLDPKAWSMVAVLFITDFLRRANLVTLGLEIILTLTLMPAARY